MPQLRGLHSPEQQPPQMAQPVPQRQSPQGACLMEELSLNSRLPSPEQEQPSQLVEMRVELGRLEKMTRMFVDSKQRPSPPEACSHESPAAC